MKKSRNALAEPIKNIRKGLAVLKVRHSPYWRVRVWIPSEGRYRVRSTKETSRIEAIRAAEEFAADLSGKGALNPVPKSLSFETYADRMLEQQRGLVKQGLRHPQVAKGDEYTVRHKEWGLLAFFGRRDITTVRTKEVLAYIAWMQKDREEPLTFSTVNNRVSCLRKILKLARDDGLISEVPSTPRPPKKDSPRPFFRFAPLVSEDRDDMARIITRADALAEIRVPVRGIPITYELKDFIRFLLWSFLRPTESEVYALRHADVAYASKPNRLLLTIRKGKTGHRVANTLPACVDIYARICKRYPDAKESDYLFLPSYKNRSTAKRIIQRQFGKVLADCGLMVDEISGLPHSVYSLRHTSICMRLVISEGKVNIFNLAKNAGTSVDQIERFYARNLPLGPEMAKNLHSYGEWAEDLIAKADAEAEEAQQHDERLKKKGLKKLKIDPLGPV